MKQRTLLDRVRTGKNRQGMVTLDVKSADSHQVNATRAAILFSEQLALETMTADIYGRGQVKLGSGTALRYDTENDTPGQIYAIVHVQRSGMAVRWEVRWRGQCMFHGPILPVRSVSIGPVRFSYQI